MQFQQSDKNERQYVSISIRTIKKAELDYRIRISKRLSVDSDVYLLNNCCILSDKKKKKKKQNT